MRSGEEDGGNLRDRGSELAVRRVLVGVVQVEGVTSLDERGLRGTEAESEVVREYGKELVGE